MSATPASFWSRMYPGQDCTHHFMYRVAWFTIDLAIFLLSQAIVSTMQSNLPVTPHPAAFLSKCWVYVLTLGIIMYDRLRRL